jgi:hypothetical protein
MSAPCYRSVSTASTCTLLFALLFLQSSMALAGQVNASSEQPDLTTLVKNITDAQLENRERVKAYSVTREYKVFGNGGVQPRTDVVAKVNFLPPNVKSYDIDQSTGGMGEKVVRHILDHEVDAARDPKWNLVNDENYTFQYLSSEALSSIPCYKLAITPKHERKDLLKATIWVDKNSYHILRLEGDPAKSPSFWVKDVHLVMEFGEVAGMWLQTETQALAHLRFGGEYKLTSQDLGYDVSRAVAANNTPAVRHRHSSFAMAASVR